MVSIERRASGGPLASLVGLALVAGLATLLSGCSYLTAGEIQDIQLDLNQLKREVGRLNASQSDGFRKIEYSLEQIEKSIDAQARLDRALVADINGNLNLIRNELAQLSAGRPLASGLVDGPAPEAPPTEGEKKLLAAANAFSVGEYDRAIEAYSAFLVEHSDSPEAPAAAYHLANCFYWKGEYAQALEGFQKALDAHPASSIAPEALISKAQCEINLKQYAAARATLQKIRAAFPEHEPDRIKSIEEQIPPLSP